MEIAKGKIAHVKTDATQIGEASDIAGGGGDDRLGVEAVLATPDNLSVGTFARRMRIEAQAYGKAYNIML